MTRSCGNCGAGFKADDSEVIQCRRHPPIITSVSGNSVTSHCPLLPPEFWCWDWVPSVNDTDVRKNRTYVSRGKKS